MENNNDYLKRAKNLIRQYKWYDANKLKLDNTIDFDAQWVVENIFKTECIYCGETDWHKLGCDRIKNDKPHTKDNVVCCCKRCNVLRGNKFTVDEMKQIGEVIKRIENRHKNYYQRLGKKVASLDNNGNIVKEYICAAQTQEDGYSARMVRRACKTENYRYKGYYWKYI